MVNPKLLQEDNGKLASTQPVKGKMAGAAKEQFPIVGIGASAGGLEALEQFLRNVPKDSGMAYVVIQHLDPTQKGMLPELLQRVTKMSVQQAKDKLRVKPGNVYVIPSNKSMSILNGILYLFEPAEPRGLRLPIDFFLRSLADDQQELSIGLILSGMGSDGSIGLKAIKEKNGIVMVQDPITAKFDSMPRNAMDSVIVDIVGPPADLPQMLYDFLSHVPLAKPYLNLQLNDTSALEKIIILLRTCTGNDFSFYKKSTIYRRIERRMSVHKIEKISSFVSFLQENPKEVDILFKELMIGVTNFFRDPKVWEKLGKVVIPDILADLPSGSTLRAWVPACSTGEEAYTLAIVFKEALEHAKPVKRIALQIFATDLDNEAVEIARRGVFLPNISADVSPERLNRYFVKTEDGYRINSEIREMIVFAQHNIIMHPPFTRIDMLSCRNLLIYMGPELQKKVLSLFYYSINSEGIMLLGSSETIGTFNHLFVPVDSKLKIYRRSNEALAIDYFNFPSSFVRDKQQSTEKESEPDPERNIKSLADDILLKKYSPPGVLVNENGDILYISGHTGKYLEPAVGKANMNIFAMLREGLRTEFPLAFQQALKKRESVVLHHVKVAGNGGHHAVTVSIHWIDKPTQLHGSLMVVFADVHDLPVNQTSPQSRKKSMNYQREIELEKELQNTREEMQNSVEAMQASQEELKSANEELQSANEELQSTNEELTSSKEEMQSLNEELQTLNAELQTKVDDFSRVDNDMKNLLNSTDIATLFLDKELNIRRFTNQATKIFKFIKSDIGRPFTDQVSDLFYPDMENDAMEVLQTLSLIQKQIPSKDGRWFSIRIMPYRTSDDRIDGLVITFINISDLKQVEDSLTQIEHHQRVLLNTTSDIVVKLSMGFKVLDMNAQAESFFGTSRENAVRSDFVQSFLPQPDQKKVEMALKKIVKDGHDGKMKTHVVTPDGKMPVLEWSVSLLYDSLNIPSEFLLISKGWYK